MHVQRINFESNEKRGRGRRGLGVRFAVRKTEEQRFSYEVANYVTIRGSNEKFVLRFLFLKREVYHVDIFFVLFINLFWGGCK